MIALEGMNSEEKFKFLLELQKRAQIQSQGDLLSFIHAVNPAFCQGRHHEIIADKLEALERGDFNRLMIFMPPRSGKSFMASVYFPAWYFGRHPRHQVLSISYNADLAKGWGRDVRNLIRTRDYQMVFSDTQISADSRASHSWKTTVGGIYNAAGIIGGIAGKGAHLGIIDDPLNEQDAYTKAARDHVIRWYPGGFSSRLMPHAKVILLMTRWHHEDLAGYILNEARQNVELDQWEIVDIPAILDEVSSKLLDLPVNTSFWPVPSNPPEDAILTGWPLEELLKKRHGMPLYQWSALYLQRPVVEGGNIIKEDYWTMWKDNKHGPDCEYIFLSLDTAFSEKETADYSTITAWGVFRPRVGDGYDTSPPHLILLGAARGRWSYNDLRKKTIEKANLHDADAIVIEDRGSGQSLIQDLQKAGMPALPFSTRNKDKISRAHACTPIFESGRVWIPKKKWAEDVILECSEFPSGKYDDYVDAVTQAILWTRENFMVWAAEDTMEEFDEELRNYPIRKRKHY